MIALRPYRDADLDALARLWAASWRSTGLAVALEPTESELYRHNYDRIPRELAAGWVVHLAWEDDRLVGFLALKPADGCLDQLFVLPQSQGAGVGMMLLDLAKQLLPDGFWLRTSVDNRRAHRFYEREGCRRGAIRPHPKFGYSTAIYQWP